MDSFHAMFWDTKVFINKKHQYLNNEILVQYLNFDISDLEVMYGDLRHDFHFILLYPEADNISVSNYDDRVQAVQKIMTKLDVIYPTLPPYDICRDIRKDYSEQLIKCLNRHAILFEDGAEHSDYNSEAIYPDKNKYGYLTCDEKGRDLFWLTHFKPMLALWTGGGYNHDDLRDDIDELNKDIQDTVGFYLRWLESVLRVHYVYAKLLDEFLHIRHAFLDEHEIAEQFEKYLKTEKVGSKPFWLLGTAEPLAVSHDVFRTESEKPILCDSYKFDNIGAFLYTDFFRGIQNNHIPKKCANCGKWFLLPFGKYSDYCENLLSDESGKTCRDVSARKKYEDKCRTDPVWLTYNRAYKAHYARYMKKKMTNAEFEKWGTYAVELREKMLAQELEFEEYERLLRM